MNELKSTLERVIQDLDSWCATYHTSSYTDPTKSLKLISDYARYSLNKYQEPQMTNNYSITKIDNNTVMIDGVKYQKVTPTSFYDKLWELIASKVGNNVDADFLTDKVMDLILEIIPEPEEYIGGYEPTKSYVEGWNHYHEIIKENLERFTK